MGLKKGSVLSTIPECCKLTNKRTFSSNLSENLRFSSEGENKVHPHNNRSPSVNTRDTEVEMASARMRDKRIRSRGSLDWSLSKNSENTERLRFPRK